MGKVCAVPKCNKVNKTKRSMFKVPSDEIDRKKWAAAMPEIKNLKTSHFICEKHFDEAFIHRKYEKHDENGKLIAEHVHLRPQLDARAIPNTPANIGSLPLALDLGNTASVSTDTQTCASTMLFPINPRYSVSPVPPSVDPLKCTLTTTVSVDHRNSASAVPDLMDHGNSALSPQSSEKKNVVKGEDLTKLVIKAIVYLENCGAKVHGVLCDGAKTNKKMNTLLGVHSTIHNTKSWFSHPVDDERKVFVFSDVPHLIKNVRNRLYNQKRLRISVQEGYVEWRHIVSLFELDTKNVGNARVCPKLTRRHIYLDNTSKMRVRLATQVLSNSVASGMTFYSFAKYSELEGCEPTIHFCKRFNDIFDALNRKMPNEGLKPESSDFGVIQSGLQWLNDWETAMNKGEIEKSDFLTQDTAEGLRLSLQSTMDLCCYLIERYEFQYLLTGRVNQDNLEKFFGTIRQAAGCNNHPTCSTFLHLYKILSVYSVVKPPKYGNCSVDEKKSPQLLMTISDLKQLYGSKSSTYIETRQRLKDKLESIIQNEDWEVDDIIGAEHDYSLLEVLDCVIYYVTGYLCKQILRRYKSCSTCFSALMQNSPDCSSVSKLIDLKTRGGLIHANLQFFNLIKHVESCFAKHASFPDVFDATIEEVLDSYHFSFPCQSHAPDILSYAICYYVRMRMRQFTHQENQKQEKHFVPKKKMSKLYSQ